MSLAFPPPWRTRPAGRAVAAAVLALSAVAVTSGCGKTVSIGDSSPATTAAASSAAASSAAAADQAGQNAGNNALQVVDSTAAQDGKTGDGGTVVGVAVQATPPQWVQLSAVTSPALNVPHLININQAVLYRFDDDTSKPSRSNCNDACAMKWPPVTIQEDGKVYLAGVDPEQVGAIRREDGAIQLTIGGWPVYRFAEDSKPGDLKGQGVAGSWFVVSPQGEKITGGR
ncbi:hypothetical protein [Couchioplanes caeruleus]|uniref:hypothetical protein n=1 Tax=Couchioplanes caeruleus TaxID=56438 RepID=UPI001B80520E|nr:hypothetical protein [Couchioplanes caeruleus]